MSLASLTPEELEELALIKRRAAGQDQPEPKRLMWRVVARPPKGRDGKRWQLRYFPPSGEGKPYQRSAKTEDGDLAQSLARREQATLNGESLTAEDVVREHGAHLGKTGARPNTIAANRTAASRLGPLLPGEVTLEALALAQDRLLEEGLAAKTINNYFRWLRSAWRWARRRGLVLHDLPEVHVLPEKRTELRPCTPEESSALLGHFDSRGGRFAWEGPYFALLAAAGSRVTETMRLRQEDLDRETGEVRFRSEETKTRSARMALVPPEVLVRLPLTEGLLWPDLRYWDVGRAWKRGLKACGLQGEKIRPHSLRRAWIADAFEAGAPLSHIMAQVGHSSPRTTLRYEANATQRDLAQSSRRVADFREARVRGAS